MKLHFHRWLSAVLAVVAALGSLHCAAAEPLRIAVIGGTGTIGQRVVAEALARGHEVRVIARDPSRVSQTNERMTIVAGDALALSPSALAGIEVVISAVGTGRVPDADGSIYLKTAESLIGTLRGLGAAAPRLIAVGGVGSLALADGSLLLERVPEHRRPEHLGQKAALDFYRGVADVRWTYASPPASIAPGERTGAYRLGTDQLLLDAEGKPGAISMEDYAVALIDEAENARHVGRRFTVAH